MLTSETSTGRATASASLSTSSAVFSDAGADAGGSEWIMQPTKTVEPINRTGCGVIIIVCNCGGMKSDSSGASAAASLFKSIPRTRPPGGGGSAAGDSIIPRLTGARFGWIIGIWGNPVGSVKDLKGNKFHFLGFYLKLQKRLIQIYSSGHWRGGDSDWFSPTFSAAVHFNSHKKVLEMTQQKTGGKNGIPNNEACGYREIVVSSLQHPGKTSN
nr:GATA transcription factor 1-like [Ipomoea batatas]